MTVWRLNKRHYERNMLLDRDDNKSASSEEGIENDLSEGTEMVKINIDEMR